MNRLVAFLSKFFTAYSSEEATDQNTSNSAQNSAKYARIRAGASTGEEVKSYLKGIEKLGFFDEKERQAHAYYKQCAKNFDLDQPFEIINLLSDGSDMAVELKVKEKISKTKRLHCTFSTFRYVENKEFGGHRIALPNETEETPIEFFVVGCSFTEFEYLICGIFYDLESARIGRYNLTKKIGELSSRSITSGDFYPDFVLNELRVSEASFPMSIESGSENFVDLRWNFRQERYHSNKQFEYLRAVANEEIKDDSFVRMIFGTNPK